MRPRLKICCIQDVAEARAAIAAGADCLGLVGRGLSGPEVIDDDDHIAAVAASVPPGVTPWLLTREVDPDVVVARVRHTRVGAVQLCDAAVPEVWRALRTELPNVRIVQVVHVQGPEAVDQARAVAPHVDAVLLDSGAPAGPTPTFGGTGATHDWAISARIVAALDTPVWLAGGLRTANVAEAYATVRPYGLDLCSGVRRDGRLDPDEAARFGAVTLALR